MKKLVCNYSVIRFLPYPETEEFVNVGILACCSQVGWMDYCIDNRRTKRVHDFFPEMDKAVYTEGRHRVIKELDRITADFREADGRQGVMPERQKYVDGIFSHLAQPREEIFRLGPLATRLTDNPAAVLEKLFNYYVERHFAQHDKYQETIMQDRLTNLLRQHKLQNQYKEARLGNEDYHVRLPFVKFVETDDHHAFKAIKPLHLAQKDATKIRDRGDAWRMKVKRLRDMGFLPDQVLFAVQFPPKNDKKRTAAAQEICEELKDTNVDVKDFSDTGAVLSFAE
jgi:hypothetical protein